jgi:hypothetical protein
MSDDKLTALYGESSVEAAAKRDQALALLFARSGWTQEQLAENFITTVIKIESLSIFCNTPDGVISGHPEITYTAESLATRHAPALARSPARRA